MDERERETRSSQHDKGDHYSLLWLLQKEEAALQQVIRLEEGHGERYISHILFMFTFREAEYTFWMFSGGVFF